MGTVLFFNFEMSYFFRDKECQKIEKIEPSPFNTRCLFPPRCDIRRGFQCAPRIEEGKSLSGLPDEF